MGKKENHKRDLIDLFEGFVETGDAERLTGYLESNSNLPGRRANLELAEAFAEVIEDMAKDLQGLGPIEKIKRRGYW